jgi:hypothetical protein
MLEKELHKFTKRKLLKLEKCGEGFFIKLPNKNEFSADLKFGTDFFDLYFEISDSTTNKSFIF